jgi:hypothetical protein
VVNETCDPDNLRSVRACSNLDRRTPGAVTLAYEPKFLSVERGISAIPSLRLKLEDSQGSELVLQQFSATAQALLRIRSLFMICTMKVPSSHNA